MNSLTSQGTRPSAYRATGDKPDRFVSGTCVGNTHTRGGEGAGPREVYGTIRAVHRRRVPIPAAAGGDTALLRRAGSPAQRFARIHFGQIY